MSEFTDYKVADISQAECGRKEIEIAEFCSEDVAFCKKLERLGIPIYVDIKATVGHEKSVIL